MGRNIPMVLEITPSHPTTLSSLTLLVPCMAVLMVVISGLCGIWPKKSCKSSNPNDKIKNKTTTKPIEKTETTTTITNSDEEDTTTKPLKPPPAASTKNFELGDSAEEIRKPSAPTKIDKSSSLHNYMSKTKSRRTLSSSISMRMSSKIKDKLAVEIHHQNKKLLKHEDSLWTKRIMLGEKCRLPNEDDDEAILYDEKGNRVSTYSESRRPMSRSVSSIDQDVSNRSSQKEILKDEESSQKGKFKNEESSQKETLKEEESSQKEKFKDEKSRQKGKLEDEEKVDDMYSDDEVD